MRLIQQAMFDTAHPSHLDLGTMRGVPDLKRVASLPLPKGAAPLRDTTKQELLRSALDFAGLCDASRVTMASPDVVEGWMNGQASMPDGKLLVLAVFLEKLGAENGK
jgi:hypothetical protein